MRQLPLLVIIHELLTPVHSINGVIWDKTAKDFVPIVNVPTFAAVNQDVLNRSRAQEIHNFQGKIVRLSYREMKNVINSNNNGTAITGALGEMWNMLAELFNFTLKPEISKEKDGSLLHSLHHNETDVIASFEPTNERLGMAQFTHPLSRYKFQLYIRPTVIHYHTWMLKLFSRDVWFAVLATYTLLSFCSYLTQSIDFEIQKKLIRPIKDYFFYNFSMMCAQTYYPSSDTKSSKIVEYLLGTFSLIINAAFNALVIDYMMQTFVVPPFRDITTLLDQTSYHIYTVHGSPTNSAFELYFKPIYVRAQRMNRLHFVYSTQEMFEKLCTSKDLTAGVLSDYARMPSWMHACRINPVGDVIIHGYQVSGISKYFKHKRSIDIGLLRLYEHGIAPQLWYRWMGKQYKEDKSSTPQAIVLEQVYFLLCILYSGLLLSLILLLLEIVIFHWNK